jgi:hypothetical protein
VVQKIYETGLKYEKRKSESTVPKNETEAKGGRGRKGGKKLAKDKI